MIDLYQSLELTNVAIVYLSVKVVNGHVLRYLCASLACSLFVPLVFVFFCKSTGMLPGKKKCLCNLISLQHFYNNLIQISLIHAKLMIKKAPYKL